MVYQLIFVEHFLDWQPDFIVYSRKPTGLYWCLWVRYLYLLVSGMDIFFCILQVVADPSLSLKQRSLIADAARSLDKAKMMRFDEKSGNFYCTELGRIASHFYIQYSSVETYNECLRRHMNETEVIVLCTISFVFPICFLFETSISTQP